MAEAAGKRTTEELGAGIVDQLQKVFAIEGKQRRMHDLENAGQQRGGFKRTNALLLEKVCQRVDFGGQFPKRVGRCGASRAKRIVALAQGRHNIGECLQWTHQAIDEGGGDQDKVDQQAEEEQDGRRGRDVAFN